MALLKSIIYVALIGILAHYIGEAIPRKLFSEKNFPFKIYKWENNGKIYECVYVKKWKSKMPDMSRYMKDMIPKSVSFSATSESIDKLIKETCVAEFIHESLCVLAFGIYLFWKNSVGIILVNIYILCNLPFIIIQRYNRPHLIRLRDRLYKKEEKKKICDF